MLIASCLFNSQIELNAHMDNKKVADWCKERGIVVSCYTPLGSPGCSWKSDDEPSLLEEPVVLQLAEKYNKSCAQVCSIRRIVMLCII